MEEPVRISSTSGLSGSATILAGKATVSSTKTPRAPHAQRNVWPPAQPHGPSHPSNLLRNKVFPPLIC